MKNKKLIGSLLVIVMLIAMFSANVFAAGPGSITVTNPSTEVSIAGNTYSAYKIFDVTYDAGKTAYNYTLDTDFTAFFTPARITGYADAYSYVKSLTTTAAITAFAKDIFTYVKANSATILADGSATVAAGLETCTISNLGLGYYLVNGTATAPVSQTITSLCMLNTTTPSVTVNPKLDVPSIDKKVYEDAPINAWGDVADYTIGETVPFRSTSAVPDMNGYASYKFIVHDTMSAGLTFNSTSVAVTIGGTSFTDFTVTNSVAGESFQIVFGSSFLTKTKDAPIVITYSAILNDKAVLFTNDNPNTINLEYSSNPYDATQTAKTPNDTVLVDTYKVDIIKYTGTFIPANYLADAHFSLKLINDTAAASIQFIYAGGEYRVATAAEIADTLVTKTIDLVSDAGGKIVVKGIDEGTYYLFETKAPAGYNILNAAVAITLTRDFNNGGTFATATDVVKTYTNGTENGTVNVQNNTGIQLPSTGGMGTTIFTVIGLVLMTSVVIVFVTRKKLTSHKK